MFGSIGFTEILIILVVVLILFGGRKIPQLARDLGNGIREFKRSVTSMETEITEDYKEQQSVPRKKKRPPKKA